MDITILESDGYDDHFVPNNKASSTSQNTLATQQHLDNISKLPSLAVKSSLAQLPYFVLPYVCPLSLHLNYLDCLALFTCHLGIFASLSRCVRIDRLLWGPCGSVPSGSASLTRHLINDSRLGFAVMTLKGPLPSAIGENKSRSVEC